MSKIDEIIERAEGIRNEVKPRANTADRVGGVLVDVAQFAKEAATFVNDATGNNIKEIETKETTEDGGENVLTLTLASGEVKTFVVRNGNRGQRGEDGKQGIQGERGLQGEVGPAGKDGAQGQKGDKGEKGDRGDTGATGATGAQGAKGEPFTYDDFTSQQIEGLKKPATDAANELNKYLDIVKLPVVETPASDTTLAMDANKVYDIKVGESLTVTLNAPKDTTVTNEYQGSFDTSDTPPTVTWAEGIVWDETPSVEANTHYEFSIRYVGGKYYGLIHGWSLTTEEE